MSNIDKQWLQQKIAEREAARDDIQFGLDEDDSNTLAALRIALASLEAEAVAFRSKLKPPSAIGSENWDYTDHRQPDAFELENCVIEPLYTAPPVPVSVPGNSAITQYFDTIALEAAREIMCDVNRRHEFLGGDVQLLSRIQCRIDDACRAAMRHGKE